MQKPTSVSEGRAWKNNILKLKHDFLLDNVRNTAGNQQNLFLKKQNVIDPPLQSCQQSLSLVEEELFSSLRGTISEEANSSVAISKTV